VALMGCEPQEVVPEGPLPDGACEADGGPAVPLQFLPDDAGAEGPTALLISDDVWTLLTEHATDDGTELATWESFNKGQTWSAGLPVSLFEDVFVGNPSTVTFEDEQWLYFQTARTRDEAPSMWRASYTDAGFGPIESVRPLLDIGGWDSRPVVWSDGGAVWVAYLGIGRRPKLAVAGDGLLFSQVTSPVTEPQESIVVGSFGDGTIVAVWQDGESPAVASQLRGSDTGWTAPRNVSSQFAEASNVRLAFVERGRVDMYYQTDDGLIQRRPVFSNGDASPQQRVNTGFIAGAGLPIPHRLPDCRVLLTVLSEPDEPGSPLGIVILDTDAPAR
jgi:hypothetical protein